jgi:hypothetical protein
MQQLAVLLCIAKSVMGWQLEQLQSGFIQWLMQYWLMAYNP